METMRFQSSRIHKQIESPLSLMRFNKRLTLDSCHDVISSIKNDRPSLSSDQSFARKFRENPTLVKILSHLYQQKVASTSVAYVMRSARYQEYAHMRRCTDGIDKGLLREESCSKV